MLSRQRTRVIPYTARSAKTSFATMSASSTCGQPRYQPACENVSQISRLLNEGRVDEVRIDRPDLESVFLSLTGRSLRDA